MKRIQNFARDEARRSGGIISSRKGGPRVLSTPRYGIRIKRVPFFPRTGNDLSAWSVRPTGLRGHGLGDVIRIRECYSEADVRISSSKVPRVPFFKGISTSPWLYFAYHHHYPYRRTLLPRYSICIQTAPDSSSCILHVPIAWSPPR